MGGMDDRRLLSLNWAAEATGYSRHELLEMLRLGRLYGLRVGGHWRIAPADLARLPARIPSGTATGTAALLAAIRERDQLIRQLRDERQALSARVDYLQAQFRENEARPAAIAAQQRALPLSTPAPPSIPPVLVEWDRAAAEHPSTARALPEVSVGPLAPVPPIGRRNTSATQRLIGRLGGLARLFRMA